MKSIFHQLMESESFKDVTRDAGGRGRLRAGPWAVEVPWVPKAGEELDPVTKYTTGSVDFPQERTAVVAPVAFRKVYAKDLVRSIGMTTPVLTYSRVTGWSASAGGVAERSAKPESGYVTEVVSETVATIATWMPYTREALRSAEGTAAFIGLAMRFFLSLAEDEAILNHNTVEFKGLLNVSGIQTQALGGDTRLDAIRKAITKVKLGLSGAGTNAAVGFQPTALLLNPTDAEEIETLKDTATGYLLIPAVAAPWWEPLQAQYWRVPVIETSALPVGTGLVGAFDIGAVLWPYGGVEVSISGDHDDFFVKNKVAIRIEQRLLLATYFPKAFCKITGI